MNRRRLGDQECCSMSATYTNLYIRPAGSTRQKDLMYAIRKGKELQSLLPEELGEHFQKEMKVEMDLEG